VREGELEVLAEELLDVGTTDVGSLLDLGDLQDLWRIIRICGAGAMTSVRASLRGWT
jgi:hypothetical protein